MSIGQILLGWMSIKDIFNTTHLKFQIWTLEELRLVPKLNLKTSQWFQTWLASAVTPGCTLHKNTHMGKQYNLLWFILPPLKV